MSLSLYLNERSLWCIKKLFDLESVTLNVINLPYMVAFYQQALGMAILEESPERVGLGVQGSDRPLLYLEAVAAL